MKFLLTAINAKYIHSNLAVQSLRTYAGKYADNIRIVEYTINHYTDDILKGLYKEQPDVIGFSCYIWNINYVKELITDLHKLLPKTAIWLGGPEVSFDAEILLEEFPQVTGVMLGEGEKSFYALVEHYVNGKDGHQLGEGISGIVYRDENNKIRVNPFIEPVDMSTIPFAYDDIKAFANKIIYYESSRGCPFSCSYCLSSVDKKLRFRNTELVKKELKIFIDEKVPQVKFVDRTFNCDHKHAMEIWKFIKENDNQITNFHFEIAADLLQEEELEFMATLRPGLIQLEIGVQSTNEKTIKEIDRVMDFQVLCEIVKKIKRGRNIHQHLDLIAGLPYEDYESFQSSFNDVYALHPDQLQLGFLKVLKGSKMMERAKDYGLAYKEKSPYEVLYTKWLSYDDVLHIKGVEEMVEVYYNSNQFTTTLKVLETVFSSPFLLYKSLSDFYKENNYTLMSHSRMERYEILLSFTRKWDPLKEEIYKDVLLFDLYLRENLKSRPAWAKDKEEFGKYKNFFREFYQKEETHPSYLKSYEGYNYKQLSKMTHIEVFSYDVIAINNFACLQGQNYNGIMNPVLVHDIIMMNIQRDSDMEKGEYVVLFDYKNKDRLFNEAKTFSLSFS